MFLKNSRRRLTTIANSGSVNFGLCTPLRSVQPRRRRRRLRRMLLYETRLIPNALA